MPDLLQAPGCDVMRCVCVSPSSLTSGSWLWCQVHGLHAQLEVRCLVYVRLPALMSDAGFTGEGNGNPLQYSCLDNPMDGGAW